MTTFSVLIAAYVLRIGGIFLCAWLTDLAVKRLPPLPEGEHRGCGIQLIIFLCIAAAYYTLLAPAINLLERAGCESADDYQECNGSE